MDTSFSLSELLCEETFLNESKQEDDTNVNPCSISESDDEYIQLLIEKESIFVSHGSVSQYSQSLQSDGWLKCARLGIINYVLSTRAIFEFQIKTAFLSLTYFDRFLSKQFIHNGKMWFIRLLSVACLSIAAKMEELNAPRLSKYSVSDFVFEANEIWRMELTVLNTLEWKMGSITPFAYLSYFTAKFSDEYKDSTPKELISSAKELILALPKDISLIDFRPSVTALAAIFAASSDDQLTRNAMESKMSVIPSLGSLEKEVVYLCYDLMREIKMEKSKTPKSVILSDTTPSPVDIRENSSITSTAVGCRRRLTYNGCHQNCPNLKRHRH